jgi:shikimate kinase
LRIVLTGFMGAGKSTVGPLLAKALGWRFIDLDQVLVQTEGASIAELFKKHAEAGFRALEEQAIVEALLLEGHVIALGGGALESELTRARLASSEGTHVVLLETPLEVALARCAQQPGAALRPVLLDQAAVAARFERRMEHYGRAHQAVSTLERTPAEVAELLAGTIRLRMAERHP